MKRLKEEHIQNHARNLRCPECRSTVAREPMNAVNGWLRMRAWCTAPDCDWHQIVGIGPDGEHRTFDSPDQMPEPQQREVGPDEVKTEHKPGECMIAGCQCKHLARGLCVMHYTRWRKIGKPEGDECKTWIRAGAPNAAEWYEQRRRAALEPKSTPAPPARGSLPRAQRKASALVRVSAEAARAEPIESAPGTIERITEPSKRMDTTLLRFRCPTDVDEVVILLLGRFITAMTDEGEVLGQAPLPEHILHIGRST